MKKPTRKLLRNSAAWRDAYEAGYRAGHAEYDKGYESGVADATRRLQIVRTIVVPDPPKPSYAFWLGAEE